MATMQRIENTQETAPRTTERGHLSLVEWPTDAPLSAPARRPVDPARRRIGDRLYEGGILLLMAATALAALVSFARL